MKKTQLIVFKRPARSAKKEGTTFTTYVGGTASSGNYYAQWQQQPNIIATLANQYQYETYGKELDLYDDVSVPTTYTILDIREPDKRKTSWSKTITIPGTKNNNRIFSHLYEISSDNWLTIGGKSVWQAFNPNLRTEVVLIVDGVEVLKGNMQLKKATKDKFQNIEYEIAINGELTSLFSDIGEAKLSDLDLSEWNHQWSKTTIENSWNGVAQKAVGTASTFTKSLRGGFIKRIIKSADTGRLQFETNTAHGLNVADFVRIELDTSVANKYKSASGEWLVVSKTTTTFTVNYFYPVALSPFGEYNGGSSLGSVFRINHTGTGYVYPMCQWGDETDYNTWPTTSFTPGFYVKQILDKIFAETNSKYQSQFLTSEFFKRLILVNKKSAYEIDTAEIKSRKFWVGTTQSYTQAVSAKKAETWLYFQNQSPDTTATASCLGSNFATKVPFKVESGNIGTASFFDNGGTQSNSIGNWNQSTYQWIVSDTGQYNLSANLKFSGKCVMNGFSNQSTNTGTASFNPTTPGYTYWPFSRNNSVSTTWKSQGNGVRIVATYKMLRGGVESQIGEFTSDHFYMNRDSYWTAANTNWLNFGTYQPQNWREFQFSVDCTNFYFNKGDIVWLEVKYYVQAHGNDKLLASTGFWTADSFTEQYEFEPYGDGRVEVQWNDIKANWQITLEDASYIFNEPIARSVENSVLEASAIVPKDMTCKDFLLGIIKMFNLHIVPDKTTERRYIIEPRDDFYYDGQNTSDFVDWTYKIDNESVEILPIAELTAKYYTFENKEDTDVQNAKFKKERGRPFQYYKKQIQNDFLTQEVKISVPFGSTVMINYPAFSDVVMPAVYSQESNGSIKPIQQTTPRILFWGGMRPWTAQRGGAELDLQNPQTSYTTGWEMLSSVIQGTTLASPTSSVYQQYPYAGLVDSPHDPYYDINWFNMEPGDFVYYDYARWTNDNLYNKYWSNMINEISDPGSKVIIADLYLTPKDIAELDFRKIYVIEGNWLRLQKVIDYDPINDGLTKCEFLRLVSPTRYRKQSIVVNNLGNYGQAFNDYEILNPNAVPGATAAVPNSAQFAPAIKRPTFGWNNTAPDVDLASNTTIQTTGVSNNVAQSSKNITITGNENSVGRGSKNINIAGGNGNFITGGMQNVNIIGTDGLYVNESDVVYINGIRYKNGTPISRASVIDALSDLAVESQSINTTSNVVDSGEDIVINAGSSTFENSIDSGQDLILPNLPDIGIGTIVNPNPRTNSSGGYAIQSPTFSIVDYVRSVNFQKS